MNRPKIVTICGSSRFVDTSAVKAWEMNKQGIATFHMPLLPHWYPGVQEHHQAEAEGVADNLDNLWLELIAMSDEIFVVNCAIPGHESGYIGQRTRIEINHALKLGKPVRYLVESGNKKLADDASYGGGHFDDDRPYCDRCSNTGMVNCHCGGDLCVCENQGEMPCPNCGHE